MDATHAATEDLRPRRPARLFQATECNEIRFKMKIGIAGPVSLSMLATHFPGESLPAGYPFAPMAMWIEELLSRGHKVVVFTHAPGIPDARTFSSEQLTVHVARQRPRGRARDFFAQERRDLLQFMRTDRCDVIHAQWTYEFAMAALDSGLPTLVTAHDAPLLILRHFRDPYRFMRLLMAWNVAQRAPHLTAVSTHVAEHFRKYLRHSRPIEVIPNALPASIFEIGKPSIPRTPSAENCQEILTVASVLTGWNRLKNGKVALQAFQILRRRMPHARFLMFGGDYAPGGAAERWARANSLVDGVEFAGALPYEQLLRRLSEDVDILLHPSREEAFGMAVAEGMALGLTIVGGKDAGAIPSLLQHGQSGELVDVSCPDSVAGALLRLGSNPALRERLGSAAFASSYQRFRGEVVFDQYEALYRRIC